VDAIALVVGTVVGAGIFRTPGAVAANAPSPGAMLGVWCLGGLVTLAGALCYAELGSAFPHPGGEYHYLTRAYGRRVGFLFAWARLTVIQTGSIALLAYVFGDYASRLWSLGPGSSSIYAALAVGVLTAFNLLGLRQGARAQNILTSVEVLGLLLIALAGWVGPTASPSAPPPELGGGSAWGMMLILVLLTFGGWNEVGYVSAELIDVRRNLVRVLVVSVALITALYLVVNLAMLKVLGLGGMAGSEAVAADLLKPVLGEPGARLLSVLVAISALTSANATILFGARSTSALGRDVQGFRALGRWSGERSTPAVALIVQGVIALVLVSLGFATRHGFQTMVEYTAPTFWVFFLLSGLSVFVLRRREPGALRPFRVPLYPFTPILFCASCAFLLYSSVAYTGIGAVVGLCVLAIGAGVRWALERSEARRAIRFPHSSRSTP
jgi:amino acid transporter